MNGLKVMINTLCGNKESVKAFNEALGKTITRLELHGEDGLYLGFSDNSEIRIYDDGQSSCEHRYMQTDDDLSYYLGSTLLGAEIKDAPNVEDEYGEHEVQFLEVKTSKGSFTMANHNEHNGYYGGFSITVERRNNDH